MDSAEREKCLTKPHAWSFNEKEIMNFQHYQQESIAMIRFSLSSSFLYWILLNTLRPRQNGHRFTDDTLQRIFLKENIKILIKISLKFVPKGQINNIPALVQIMAWRRPGDKPLSETMMVRLETHICVTRPQWVKPLRIDLTWGYDRSRNND